MKSVKPVKYAIPYSNNYKGSGEYTLVNAVHGTTNHADGEWQGWEGQNMDVILDLQQPTDVSKISVGSLQNSGAWIFFPKKVEFFVSADGAKFQKVGEVITDVDPLAKDKQLKEYAVRFAAVKASFVKVVATSLGKAPKGHQGAGDNAWLFIDEIAVE